MYHQTYTQYNDKKTVEALDLNRYDPFRATIFPYGVYSGAILPVDDYTCGQAVPRDTESDYIIDRERTQHPNHFSRFGYARSFYGYVTGAWPGRYRPNWFCQHEAPFTPPADMAPPQFYKSPNVGPFSDRSKAYEGALKARLDVSPGPLTVGDVSPALERTMRQAGVTSSRAR